MNAILVEVRHCDSFLSNSNLHKEKLHTTNLSSQLYAQPRSTEPANLLLSHVRAYCTSVGSLCSDYIAATFAECEPHQFPKRVRRSYRWTSKQIGIQGYNSTVFTDCYFLFLGGGNQTFRISDISFSNYSNSQGNVIQANSGLSFHFNRVKFLQTSTGDVILRNRSDLSTVIVYSRITLYIDECIFSGMKGNGRMIYLRQAIGHISNTIFRNSPGCTAIALALDATTKTYYDITMENVIMEGLSTGILGTLLTPFSPLYVNVYIHNLTCTLTGAGSSVVDLSAGTFIAADITVSDSSFIGGNEALNNLFSSNSGPNQFTVLRTTFNNLQLPLYKCIFSTRGTARVLISDVTVKNITGPVCNVMSNVFNDETDNNRVPLSSLMVRHSSFESTVVPTSALFTFVSSNIDVENCTFIKVDTLLGAIYHRSASESLSLVSIRRSTFQTVSSIDDGGAVSLTGSFYNVSVTDCSFTDIISEGAGGSIFIIGRAERVDVKNVNVSNSISTDGGHMYISLTGGVSRTFTSLRLTRFKQSQVTIEGCRLVEGVKQILSDSVSAIQLKDFLGEVAILQGVRSHPNVVTFMGLTFPPQPLSLVTEFCHGGGLDSYLTKNEIPLESLKPIMRGIALGMNHLHSEGIIHRDLAARNILLTQHLEPKVSDFGMSRRAEEGVGMTQTAIGPVRWMAPEAITSRVYSTKSDVYSFGVLIWEMVSGGKLPYEEMDTVEAAVAVVTNGLRPSIPDDMRDRDLVQLMSLCWTTQPEGRPEFRVILNRYLSATSSAWVEDLPDVESQQNRYVSALELEDMPNHYSAIRTEDTSHT
ncbi:Tyrosine kinase specific for activated (GTP-bound) p21cdc42Hs (ISS) [Planoprotostelium fungivorum]|uniref:Tyrosine kinase specific for activated (GTP-bound) p21cdc42Hs (ISS) n=1 Tax=Planoprotostelium fungivorum TaxID=1890364 RepID=A0A2P6MVH5_9EUKA|nr:Tyrosine kinase specific for activated (GTP-bound) p21cdc42Hs (ISS) [Planoprotostelium fungivorum]